MSKSAGHHFYHSALHGERAEDCSISKDHTLLLDFFPSYPVWCFCFCQDWYLGLASSSSVVSLEFQPKIHLFHKGWMIFRMILLLRRRFFSY